ncbi:MAG TPA: hypothetical protein VJ817_13175 [Gemmatimonadales bacterium]|nr:hypothetical protein [Gemmatimonadales bacterium]
MITACAVTPISRRIRVGEEPFVIGVGEGSDSMTDLFAAPAGGGVFVRLTFTRAEERLPRLSPEGTAVAFVRREGGAANPRWALVVLDLLTTAERRAPLPAGTEAPMRTGWARDGSAVVLAGGYFTLAPKRDSLLPVSRAQQPAADSATRELLGDPPAAMVGECAAGELCITAANGDTSRLGTGNTGAIRWGADSLGYFTSRGFEVRPLSAGSARRPDWTGKPSALRSLTHHPGRTAR